MRINLISCQWKIPLLGFLLGWDLSQKATSGRTFLKTTTFDFFYNSRQNFTLQKNFIIRFLKQYFNPWSLSVSFTSGYIRNRIIFLKYFQKYFALIPLTNRLTLRRPRRGTKLLSMSSKFRSEMHFKGIFQRDLGFRIIWV